jgi:hypothetical protein
MREMGVEAWKWIAVSVLMALITLMMVLGLGAKRGTRLNKLRLSMWAMVIGLGGVFNLSGCSDDDYGQVDCYYPMDDSSEYDPGMPPDAPPDSTDLHESPDLPDETPMDPLLDEEEDLEHEVDVPMDGDDPADVEEDG